MTIKITPTLLKGRITPPPSKSVSHRALICCALAGGGKVLNPLCSDDIRATTAALQLLKSGCADIDCGESGSTLRFLIPVFAARGITATFRGKGELPRRPITPYLEELPKHGVVFETTSMPYVISGKLTPGEFSVSGDISSQFVTGLLLALPLLDGDSKIIPTSLMQSKPYVDITLDVMRSFGVTVNETTRGYFIKGGQRYTPRDFTVEADMSQAAFFAVANRLGSAIEIQGLNKNSLQGDGAILDIVRSFPPHNIDASDIPDLVPILTVLCALTDGEHRIRNCSRLRLKECDRLTAISTELNKIGGRVKIGENDDLIILGVKRLTGDKVCSTWNDHRIAMALTVAATKCASPLILENAECVKKSYENFYDDIKKLGGIINVVSE